MKSFAKKFLLIFCLLLCACSVFAEIPLSFVWNAGTAAISYGDDLARSRNSNLRSEKYFHLLLTGDVAADLKLDDFLLVSGGLTASLDFYGKNTSGVLYVDYAPFLGLRIFPGIGGLYFGVDYTIGQRGDILFLPDDTRNRFSQWGNGFRFSAEYDFSEHTSGFAPVVSVSYRSMPRGGSRDHLFALALSAKF